VSNRINEPHRTACYEVLNLPSQVGVLPGGSALALAYRVTFVSLDPFVISVWLRTLEQQHVHSRATILYHKKSRVSR